MWKIQEYIQEILRKYFDNFENIFRKYLRNIWKVLRIYIVGKHSRNILKFFLNIIMKYFRKQFPVTTFCSSQLFPPNPLSPVVEICKFFSENLAAGSPNLFLRYNNRQFSKLLCSFNSIRWNLLSAIMPIILDVQFALDILHWNILYFYCADEFWFLDIWESRHSQLSLNMALGFDLSLLILIFKTLFENFDFDLRISPFTTVPIMALDLKFI